MKHGNMRTYGTILTEKLASEKCTTRASPCIRYFVNAEGERVSNPEEFAVGKDAYITPTEYRKRVDNLPKRDELGKFVKKSAEGKEEASDASEEDEGGIVRGGGEKEPGEALQYSCFGTYEDNRYDSCEGCDIYDNCKVVTLELQRKNQTDYPEQYETNDDLGGLAEPEPAWTSEYVGESASKMFSLPDGPCEPMIARPETPETPEQMWVHIAYYLGAIKQQGIRQVEEDIQGRINQILGGR